MLFVNYIFGDSAFNPDTADDGVMSGYASGGHNTLTGGNNSADESIIGNLLVGNAFSMTEHASGGHNTLIGGNISGSGSGVAQNEIFGDAYFMSGSASGGHNTLTGGNNSSNAGFVENDLIGDAFAMSENSSGGYNTLIAGLGINVYNNMWGDAQNTSTASKQVGHDLFVFKDKGSMTVGTQNFIYDFSELLSDKIEFSHVAGVKHFSDLQFLVQNGDTTIQAGNDSVTLVGFTSSLHASDFIFA